MQDLEGIVAILAILVAIGLPVVAALMIGLESIKSKHRERMGLINQGIIPPDTAKLRSNPNRFVSLRNGIVLISLGIGLPIGLISSNRFASSDTQSFYIMASSVVLFIGIGYLLYFIVTRKLQSGELDIDVIKD